nr:hypothetical protein [Tanacetum cinerariifolium]
MHETQQTAVQNSNSSTPPNALILYVIEQLKNQVINCAKINLDNKSVNDTLTVELKRYKEQVKVLKEGQNIDLQNQDNVLDSCEQSVKIGRLKETLSEQIKEKECLKQIVTLLKNDFKKEKSRNINREISLEKKIKELDNIVYKRDQSTQTTHMLTKPQFFYDHTTKQALDPSPSCRPTKVEVPKELPKVGMCLKLETELLNNKDFIEKETYDKLFRNYTTLEKHCISLEVDTQLNQEIFQRDNSVSNQSAPSFDQYFELNELKAQSHKKYTVIRNLKERIKSLCGNMNKDKVKKDIEEIETINIELDHMVSKLIAENENLKHTYKKLYDSIKPIRVRSKEQCDALINQVNQKSVEIFDLNANLQVQGLIITGVKPSTSASGSQPSGNSKKDKIQRPPSSTKKNKVETHPRTVKSSLKNMDCAIEPKGTANVQHSKLNANSKLICVKCNGCMLSDNHDLCVLNVINDVNARYKSKSVKKTSKRKV